MSYSSKAKLEKREVREKTCNKYIGNINPLAVLISLPIASIQHGILRKKGQRYKHYSQKRIYTAN